MRWLEHRRIGLAVLSVGTLLLPWQVRANPQGGVVVGGAAAILGQGSPGVVVNQSSQQAIINWSSFNIAPGETTRFIQPNAAAVTLNRVTGSAAPSTIFGNLVANGQVFLINPEGFIFGPGAKINTASFLATTHDIRNDDFMAGRYAFTIPGNPSAAIINQGSITVADTGIAVLVAPGVRNDGIITARLGKVALASGNGFTLDLYGDNLIKFQVGDQIASQVIDPTTGKPLKNLVDNTGTLSSNGGMVVMTAVTARAVVDSVINTSGTIEARSVGVSNGRIVLGAETSSTKASGAPTQRVGVSGRLDASGKNKGETGGSVQVTGESIALSRATIDATGFNGGGKIFIGGDYHGGAPLSPLFASTYGVALEDRSIPNATTVTADSLSTLDASALSYGNGGKVVVWSDGTTTFKGSLFARGGQFSGNGGFAEVSGAKVDDFAGMVASLSAPHGKGGTILFDPSNDVIIGPTEAQTIADILNQGTSVAVVATPTGPGYSTTAPNDNTFYYIDPTAGIIINSNIIKTSGGDAFLYFDAGRGITVAPGVVIGSSSGKLDVSFFAALPITDTFGNPPPLDQLGRVTFGAGVKIYTNGGIATMNPADTPSYVFINDRVPADQLDTAEKFLAYSDRLFASYIGGIGSLQATSQVSEFYDVTGFVLPGQYVPNTITSALPLPGIGVGTGVSYRDVVSFATLVHAGGALGLYSSDIWEVSQYVQNHASENEKLALQGLLSAGSAAPSFIPPLDLAVKSFSINTTEVKAELDRIYAAPLREIPELAVFSFLEFGKAPAQLTTAALLLALVIYEQSGGGTDTSSFKTYTAQLNAAVDEVPHYVINSIDALYPSN